MKAVDPITTASRTLADQLLVFVQTFQRLLVEIRKLERAQFQPEEQAAVAANLRDIAEMLRLLEPTRDALAVAAAGYKGIRR